MIPRQFTKLGLWPELSGGQSKWLSSRFFLKSRQFRSARKFPTRSQPQVSSLNFATIGRKLHRIPPNTLVYGLIGVNVAVFAGWQYANGVAQRFRDAKPIAFMFKNFCLSEANLFSGRIWTLVTSCFSHTTPDHLLFNMVGLYFLAPAVASMVGSASFLSLYLLAGVGSGLGFLALNRVFAAPAAYNRWGQQMQERSFLSGASGSVYGIMSFFAMANPSATFLLFLVVPVPAWALVPGLFCWDLYRTINRSAQSKVASSAHVCGLLTGVAYYMMRYRRPPRMIM